jgi:hypothetical protein
MTLAMPDIMKARARTVRNDHCVADEDVMEG